MIFQEVVRQSGLTTYGKIEVILASLLLGAACFWLGWTVGSSRWK
jgi:hypothetical protein